MSELEEKLNALLSDPNSMAQVMQMAQQLSGAMGEQKACLLYTSDAADD